MRQHGLHGVVRGRRFRTTIPDPALTARLADLVRRAFRGRGALICGRSR